MEVLSNLEPKSVWKYFEEICQVPRPSKKEEKIIDFLMGFAKINNLVAEKDKIGNVIIRKPATEGKENVKTAVLQSHMDMVCEKNADVKHNFDKDPIIPFIDGDWVKAKGTTLGADDGIGMAAQMALLTATDIEHGPIECLFTVDEETGLTGANAIQPGFMKGNILLNLDSEDDGELFIGCAGGKDTLANFKYKTRKTPKNRIALKIKVAGLKGGHSGDDINKGQANSIKLLNKVLLDALVDFKAFIASFEGGNLRNAIPREAEAVIVIREKYKKKFVKNLKAYTKEVNAEFALTDPGITINYESVGLPKQVLKRPVQRRLLHSLQACQHGVIEMSQKMPGMVETSTNLASVKFQKNNIIQITTSQRSDSDFGIDSVTSLVASVFKLGGATVIHTDGYPGWAPNPNSEIVKITADAYEKLFSEKPIVRSIHAGLECGLFLQKYPEMDMISFGPTLRNVHSPEERIEIPTVKKFWELIIEVLKNIPENK